MVLKEFGLDIEVKYEVAIIDNPKAALITPVMLINAVKRNIIIARMEVDGHELTPCTKIVAEPGTSAVSLRSVKIINPLPGQKESNINSYRMTMEISPVTNVFERFEQNLSIIIE
jgi:hypothetical protein